MSDRFERMANDAASKPTQLRADYQELISFILLNVKDRESAPGGVLSRRLNRVFEVHHSDAVYYFSLKFDVGGQTQYLCEFGRDYATGRFFFKDYGKARRFSRSRQDVESLVIQALKSYHYL